jgi:hypothetical protein
MAIQKSLSLRCDRAQFDWCDHLLFVVSLLLGFGAIASPASALSYLLLDSQLGDPIGQGGMRSYDESDGNFQAWRNFDNGVSFSFSDPDVISSFWFLDFAAPGSVPITPGTYLNAQRFPFQDNDRPGLDVSGEHRGCNTLQGEFTVTEVVYGTGNNVERFAASFEQLCEGGTAPLTGELGFNLTPVPFEFEAATGLGLLGCLWFAQGIYKQKRRWQRSNRKTS